ALPALLVPELEEKAELAAIEPFRHGRLQRGDPDRAALDLTPLNREIDLGRAAIAPHELSVESKHLARDQHDVGVGAARSKAAEKERTARSLDIHDGLERRVGPDDDAIGIVLIARRGAEPGERLALELGGRIAEHGLDRIGT